MKTGNRIIMVIAGLLLAAAALFKVHEALTVYIAPWREGIWESYEFFLLQIPLEFALGVWILSGVFRKAAWIAGTLAFFAFIIITLAKGILGFESCGCFGRVHVNPWHTLFIVDIPIFLLLLIFRPKGEKLLPPPWPHPFHALATAIPAIGFMAIAAPLLVAFRPEFKKPGDWTSVKPVRPIPIDRPVLNPQPKDPAPAQPEPALPVPAPTPPTSEPSDPAPTAVNETEPAAPTATTPPAEDAQQWPWLQHIDIADQIKHGLTVILMYHHDCPTCAEMMPRYSEYCKQMQERGDQSIQVAFIAIPPFHQTGPVPADTVCLLGKLSDKEKWAIMSPYVVALADGYFVRDWPQGTAPEPENLLDEIFDHD
jgi:hypothetical protein